MNIDLKTALFSPNDQKKIVKKQPVTQHKPEVEDFVPKFVDCDRTTNTSSSSFFPDDSFELTTLRDFKSRSKFESRKFSVVGRIIATKFKMVRPKIHHGYQVNPAIQRFLFDSPSPDDKILAHLNKAKK